MKFYKIIILTTSQIFTLLFNFFVQVILAKYYGISETGTYFSLISLMNIMSVVGLFGINKYYIYIKSANIKIDDFITKNLMLVYIVLNIICGLLLFIIGYIRFPDYILFTISCMFLMILTNSIAIISSVIQINDKIINISFLNLIVPFLKVSGLIIGMVFVGHLLIGYSIYITLFSIIILTLFTLIYIKKNKEIMKQPKTNIKHTIRTLIPYALLNIFFLIYTQGNTFYLGILSSTHQAAYFGISYLFLNTIFIFPTAVYQKILAHKMIYFLFNNVQLFKLYYKSIQELLLSFSILAMLCIYFLSDWLILLFFGNEYKESIEILKLLVIIIPFRLMTISIGTILSNDKYIKSRLHIEILVTFLNAIINFSLIPFWGINGALTSVIITEISIAVLFEKTVNNDFNIKLNKSIYLLLILSLSVIFIKFNLFIEVIIVALVLLISFKMIFERVKSLWKGQM
ncbi:MATE family efflux transporter [Staphylococcus xylosus]|nr:hypothetical protein [Staphylococcus xylosus]MBO1206154.1 hypothetical protein [Staphylococcus nepalensis]MEB8096980.1 hypothetical protein [Staphylococcus xylosus]UBV40154.1 hypothetical protein JGY87_00310 [Staphylococcus xylosus]